MNPTDVAQSALPLASADVSLITLLWQAHWIVKTVKQVSARKPFWRYEDECEKSIPALEKEMPTAGRHVGGGLKYIWIGHPQCITACPHVQLKIHFQPCFFNTRSLGLCMETEGR